MENFTAYLQSKNLSPVTIKEYTRQINLFVSWCGTDDVVNIGKKEVLNYLSHLKNQKNFATISSNNALIALRHYFGCLLQQTQIHTNPTALIQLRGIKRRKLHYHYNPEELTELADSFYQLFVKAAKQRIDAGIKHNTTLKSYYAQLRNYVMLQLFIYQGLQTKEVLNLTTSDIELHKAAVNIAAGTRGKARAMPLQATQIGALMQYLNEVRPNLINAENPLLFLPTQIGNEKGQATRALIQLTGALKRIDKNFASLAQLRASLITYWIQTYGLRKAQYLAGHKSINSTEEFLPNHIEDLAEDITKFNPF